MTAVNSFKDRDKDSFRDREDKDKFRDRDKDNFRDREDKWKRSRVAWTKRTPTVCILHTLYIYYIFIHIEL